MEIPEIAYIRYLVMTTCECETAKNIILDFINKLHKSSRKRR